MSKGAKYGREAVRAIPEPLDGAIVTGQCVAANDNFDGSFIDTGASPQRTDDLDIEGIVIKADDDNTGEVRVCTIGEDHSTGYPLAASETIALHIDKLSKVALRIDVSGEIAHYIVIVKVL